MTTNYLQRLKLIGRDVRLYLVAVMVVFFGDGINATLFNLYLLRMDFGPEFIGLLFGIALGPCTFAYMAPMLAVTFRLAATNLAFGVALLLAYGLGHCMVIVVAGTSTGLVQRYMNWNQIAHGTDLVKKACGVLVMLGGLYLIYIAP